MKTVLFIDYFFPPLLWGWRSAVIAKYLSELGWKPICLSAEPGHYSIDSGFDLQQLNGIKIHRVFHQKISRLQRYWRYAQRKLRIGGDFPDSYQDWIRPAFQEGCKILDQEKIDLIYSLSPTYATAYVAMKLKKKYGIPWVMDFMDPWSTNPDMRPHYKKTLIQPIRSLYLHCVRMAEGAILKLADKIIYPIETAWNIMQNLYPNEAPKMEMIPSGYDEATFEGLTPQRVYPEKLVITYLGTWYEAYREPTETLMNVLNEIDPDVEVIFIGRGAQAVHSLNLKNATCILHLSREKSHAFALGSDFLLMFLPPSYKHWMASKLYTYFRLGRPILALVPEETEAARLIQQAHAGFVLSFDPIKLKEQLRDMIDRWKKGEFKNFQPNQNYLTQFEQKTLTKRMVKIFDEVVC